MEGFTQNRRDWNYTEMMKDDKQRLDLLFGLKVGWMLPLYGKHLEQFYSQQIHWNLSKLPDNYQFENQIGEMQKT